MNSPAEQQTDVVVIGGGAAGLQAALGLGRMRRSVVVIDAGEQRNSPAPAMHNVLTLDGVPPGEALARGRAELDAYDVRVLPGRVVSAGRVDAARMQVETADGPRITARRVVVATGLVDDLPDIPGLRERWGRDVFHCPYCHGWELRDRDIVVLGLNPFAPHVALTLGSLARTVTLVQHTAPELDADQASRLQAAGVRVIRAEASEIVITDDTVSGVRLTDGEQVPAQAVAITPFLHARLEGLDQLGLQTTEHPSGLGTHLPTNPRGVTDVPGIFAAGNVTDPAATVAHCLAAGATVAATVNADLIAEDSIPAQS